MSKNRKRFTAVLLSAQMTALAVPAATILASETDSTPVPAEISETISEQEPADIQTIPSDVMPGTGSEDTTPEGSGPAADPVQPVLPEEPKEPNTPAEPEVPVQPEKPEDPAEPDTPKQPDTNKPSDQEVKPSVPDTPAAPSAPQEPAAPAQPEKTVEKPQPDAVQPAVSYKTVKAEKLNVSIADKGYKGSLKKALKLDDFKTASLTEFLGNGNPFMVGQCTWFAWARFYQVYGFDSGARGNGKTNAREIAAAHADKFELSSTPAAGATFSLEKNTLYPQYGHVGFVEAFDGEYMWISEGNVMFNGSEGNIWIHKVRWDDFKATYPDAVFAIPKKGVCAMEGSAEPKKRVIRLKTKKVEKTKESDMAAKAPRRIGLRKQVRTVQ